MKLIKSLVLAGLMLGAVEANSFAVNANSMVDDCTSTIRVKNTYCFGYFLGAARQFKDKWELIKCKFGDKASVRFLDGINKTGFKHLNGGEYANIYLNYYKKHPEERGKHLSVIANNSFEEYIRNHRPKSKLSR